MGEHDALQTILPAVARRLPRVALGAWPTPVEPLRGLGRGDVYVKREDLSARAYGGNKLRPLEVMFGRALERGARRVWSTGAYGSNHAVAAALHAPRVGLAAGAVLIPQPTSETARANLRALLGSGCAVRLLRSVVEFPFSVTRVALGGRSELIMAPGAAVPLGALGHLSAGLELAMQLEAGAAPAPRHVVLPVGSTCTTAGLIVALTLAARLGVGWRGRAPRVHAVRVTPWPVTDARRVAALAARSAALLARLGGPDLGLGLGEALERLTVSGRYLGRGYGRPSRAGRAALARFAAIGGPALDTTYSAKAAAYLLANLAGRALEGPVLFWSTKSAAPLPEPTAEALASAPAYARRWLKPDGPGQQRGRLGRG